MRTLAYCTEAAAVAVGKAVGVKPLTSPPLTAGTVTDLWTGADFVYIRLHGRPDVPDTWFGQSVGGDVTTALTLDDLHRVSGVWLLANCYGASSPFVGALYRAGAQAVIAGAGPNYAARSRVIGADLLARWLRYGLSLGLSVQWALTLAKARTALSYSRAEVNGRIVCPNADTLAFKLIERAEEA